jgi:hypothetical protein
MENIPTSKGRLSNGLLEKRHSIRNERNPKNVVEARRGTTTNRADSMPRYISFFFLFYDNNSYLSLLEQVQFRQNDIR